jgi:hypothetical protein
MQFIRIDTISVADLDYYFFYIQIYEALNMCQQTFLKAKRRIRKAGNTISYVRMLKGPWKALQQIQIL